jgi:peptidoglycan biosynthesis protein MviN/MurJ (putative lipid II flippase)
MLPITNTGIRLLMGVGDPVRPAFFYMVVGVINLLLSIALVGPLGLLGVALGTAIPNVVLAIGIGVVVIREARSSVGEFLRYVWLRPLLGAMPVAALLYYLAFVLDLHGLGGILLSGFSSVGLFAFIWVFFVYRNDPHHDLRHLLARLLRRATLSRRRPRP